MATHCSTLAWEIPWIEESRRIQSMRVAKESDIIKPEDEGHVKSRCSDGICSLYYIQCWNESFSLDLYIQFSERTGISMSCLGFRASLGLMSNEGADNWWFYFESSKCQSPLLSRCFCLPFICHLKNMGFLLTGQRQMKSGRRFVITLAEIFRVALFSLCINVSLFLRQK